MGFRRDSRNIALARSPGKGPLIDAVRDLHASGLASRGGFRAVGDGAAVGAGEPGVPMLAAKRAREQRGFLTGGVGMDQVGKL